MKLGATLLVAGVLMASASIASAAGTPATPQLTQPTQTPQVAASQAQTLPPAQPAVQTPAVASPDCAAQAASAPLLADSVLGAVMQSQFNICGSCSGGCAGAGLYSLCALPPRIGGTGYCKPLTGNLCPSGDGLACRCTNGALF